MPTKPPLDLRTKAVVLKRINYGEADRILTLLTPKGQYSVLAKASRKERSKLAGGIELFCLSEITIHHGRSSLATLTSAKMLKTYTNLTKDFDRLTLAAECLKLVAKNTRGLVDPAFFQLTEDTLSALNDFHQNQALTSTWFRLNLARLIGEMANCCFDCHSSPLSADQAYIWDFGEKAFRPAANGNIHANHIKLLRLMLNLPLPAVNKVKRHEELIPELLPIAESLL